MDGQLLKTLTTWSVALLSQVLNKHRPFVRKFHEWATNWITILSGIWQTKVSPLTLDLPRTLQTTKLPDWISSSQRPWTKLTVLRNRPTRCFLGFPAHSGHQSESQQAPLHLDFSPSEFSPARTTQPARCQKRSPQLVSPHIKYLQAHPLSSHTLNYTRHSSWTALL